MMAHGRAIAQAQRRVASLAEHLLNERRVHDDRVERIARLEERIVKQKRALSDLEQCRLFERQTERMLEEALRLAAAEHSATRARIIANDALEELYRRRGPRPDVGD
jgi:hypothetical protein